MIVSHIRDLNEFKELYDSRPMPYPYEFEFLINNPNLFCFYDEKPPHRLLCFATVQYEGDELTLSGVSVRKNYKNNVIAAKTICNLVKEDIYAYTPLKEAGLVLKKAGFEKVYNNDKELYKWRFRYNGRK